MNDAVEQREPGWCQKHDDFAWRYQDGSIQCLWAAIVETGAQDCQWMPWPGATDAARLADAVRAYLGHIPRPLTREGQKLRDALAAADVWGRASTTTVSE